MSSCSFTATKNVIDCEDNGPQMPILAVPVQLKKDDLAIDSGGGMCWREFAGRSAVAGLLPTDDRVAKQAQGALKGKITSAVSSLWTRPPLSLAEGLLVHSNQDGWEKKDVAAETLPPEL